LFRSPETVIASLIVLAIILLVSFPIHEFSHALAAYELGDSTAKLFGRLTLNPIAHFDPVGGLIACLPRGMASPRAQRLGVRGPEPATWTLTGRLQPYGNVRFRYLDDTAYMRL